MKISPETRKILNNLSNIDNQLVIDPSTTGSETHVILANKSILVCAKIKEIFTKQLRSKDLGQLVKILGFSPDSELEVFDEHCVVRTNNTKTTLRYWHKADHDESYKAKLDNIRKNGLLSIYKAKVPTLAEFEMQSDVMEQITKMQSVIKSDKICLTFKDDKFSIKLFNSSQVSDNNGVFDLDSSSSDIYTFEVELLSEVEKGFQVVVDFEIFRKIMLGSYEFHVFLNGVICKSIESHIDIEYMIPALERESRIF